MPRYHVQQQSAIQPGLAADAVGLGLRRGMLDAFSELQPGDIDFFEVAPENWIDLGGRFGKAFEALAEKFPVTLHGLSLNIGGFAPLDYALIDDIAAFIDRFDCRLYSEHLTYCGDSGHLYDLMPIPFTDEAVAHVAERVIEVQRRLGRKILLENASYYAALDSQMTESQFITGVLEEADCGLLLDVNNVYVNSVNHGYDARQFLRELPLERAAYMHIAGHFDEADDLKVDTHGAPVIESVWQLLGECYGHCGSLPTLLERDFNFPPMAELLDEISRIRDVQATREVGQ